ncbi:MAG: anhydro-N-acetylmuramic acid kinase [Betaproteobacteria bacterium]|nr:MAG: anhydro-N-acetylmuramic acid kinase [Betaproteobacteria bacterium]
MMSGTSLDGVDSVLVDLRGRPFLLGAAFLPYPKSLKATLLALHETSRDELHRAALAGIELSRLYAKAADRLLEKHGIPARNVSAIGCHGQTVRHRPGSGYSLQLGNPAWLAERTGIRVVADFRSRDIAAGGQGAPLVPAFHAAVFRDSRRHRVIANLGGIANLTDLPREGPVTGFDTGPGNVLLDAWMRERFGHDFDRGGALAARGRPVAPLLKRLLADPYFHRSPPKSTGRDHFSSDWLHRFGVGRHAAGDVQTTLAELTARSVAKAIAKYCPGAEEVYLCGGGVRNYDLVMRITRELPGMKIASTERLGIHPDWVEAMAFAWLARRALKGETGNLPEVTGAKSPRVLGAIYAA